MEHSKMKTTHSINDVIWCIPFDGYAVIHGVTPELHLCVRWYDDDGGSFTAIVAQEDCVSAPVNSV